MTRTAIALLACAISIPHIASAQALTSSIAGRAVDPQSAAVPNTKITIRNTDNAFARIVSSGPDGAFRAAGLVPGAYTVEASAGPLTLKRPLRLTVTLGSSVQVVLKLTIATVKQGAKVTARTGTVEGQTTAPPPNTAEASVGSFLPGLTVTYLPNRDRDFTQFTNQAAATTDDPDGAGISIAGQRSASLAFEVDGTEFTNGWSPTPPARAASRWSPAPWRSSGPTVASGSIRWRPVTSRPT